MKVVIQLQNAKEQSGYDQAYDGYFNATNTFIRNMAWAATHDPTDSTLEARGV